MRLNYRVTDYDKVCRLGKPHLPEKNEYEEGDMREYLIMTKDIVKCLKKFGNTCISINSFNRSIIMIWKATYNTAIHVCNFKDLQKTKKFEYCKKLLISMLSEHVGFTVTLRVAGPWGCAEKVSNEGIFFSSLSSNRKLWNSACIIVEKDSKDFSFSQKPITSISNNLK